MNILTREQRVALKRIYDRSNAADSKEYHHESYLAFRRLVQGGGGGAFCMVPYCGMWLGIEHDGYTHS